MMSCSIYRMNHSYYSVFNRYTTLVLGPVLGPDLGLRLYNCWTYLLAVVYILHIYVCMLHYYMHAIYIQYMRICTMHMRIQMYVYIYSTCLCIYTKLQMFIIHSYSSGKSALPDVYMHAHPRISMYVRVNTLNKMLQPCHNRTI